MPNQFTPFAEYIKNRPEPKSVSSKREFQVQNYHKNDVIFAQGARGYAAYAIKEGEVEISIRDDGKRTVLTTLGEQCVFGEMALILGNHTRSATAIAREDTEVVRIPKNMFDTYMKESPKVISTCLVAIARRLHEFSDQACQGPATIESMARILDLVQLHDRSTHCPLLYSKTIQTLSLALGKEKDEIEQGLVTMDNFNLLDISQGKEKQITLLGGHRFLEKALNIFSLIQGQDPI